MWILLTAVLALTICPLIMAATIHVPGDQPTIQSGVNIALPGDTVLVAPGEYVGGVAVNKALYLISSGGADNTIIRPGGTGMSTLEVTGSSSTLFVLSGFTLTGAVSVTTAVRIEGPTFRVEGNYFTNNHNCNNIVIGSVEGKFLGNQVWNNSGGGCSGLLLHSSGNVEVAGNVFHDNFGSSCAGIRTENGVNSIIHHNLLYANVNTDTWYAAALNINGYWKIWNNTVVDNSSTAANATAAVWAGNELVDVRNNIVVSNTNLYGIRSAYNASYNDAWGNDFDDYHGSSGTGNISSDPLFRSALSNDYWLSVVSPCRDAGDPRPEFNDFDGSRCDIGAYGYIAEQYPIALWINMGTGIPADSVPTLTPTFYWTYFDSAATTQQGLEVEVGTDTTWDVAEMWQTGQVASLDTNVVYAGAPLINHNTYYLRVRLSNGTTWGEWSYASFMPRVSSVIYVPSETPTIQGAVDASRPGDTIRVAAGTYQENVSVPHFLFLLSESDADSTFLQGLIPDQTVLSCHSTTNDTILIRGFSISGASGTKSVVNFSSCQFQMEGCKVVNSSCSVPVFVTNSDGILRDNQFLSNVGSICGGVFVENTSVLLIEANLFKDNTGTTCGGIRVDANTTGIIERNILHGNTSNSSGYATAMNVNGSWKLINNTVAENTALIATAAVWIGWGVTDVRNNIIAFNDNCAGLRGAQSDNFNNCFGNTFYQYDNCWSGLGNLVVDPLFTDQLNGDFTLQSGSPCINAGDPSTAFYDPDGTRNDMGAIPTFSGNRVIDLRILDVSDPEHLVIDNPTIGWNLVDTAGSAQDQFEIAVGIDDNWNVAEAWSPPVFVSSENQVVYAGAPLLDSERYWVRVRARGAAGWTDWSSTSFRVNSAPMRPNLGYPLDSTVVSWSLRPDLSIRNTFDAQGDNIYLIVELSTDSTFTSPSVYTATQSNYWGDYTVLYLDQDLLENGQYFWRAKASDHWEDSPFSGFRTFFINTENTPLESFDLVAPENGFEHPLGTRTPTLEWQVPADPDPLDRAGYTIYIATDSNFYFQNVIANIGTNSYDFYQGLDWRLKYWWKVKAHDRYGVEAWSTSTFKFRLMTPGDADGNLLINISDVVLIINYIFGNGPAPIPVNAADADCSEFVSISDAVYLIQYVFAGGPQPCDPANKNEVPLMEFKDGREE